MTLAGLLTGADATAEQVAGHLDRLAAGPRVDEVVSLSAPQQKRLWQIASVAPGPAGRLDGDYAGRNSLRLLNHFHKRFARAGPDLVGHNQHPLSWLIGPGYFTVEPAEPGRLLFDYARIPASSPPGWPAVHPNTGVFARAVYGNLVDRVAWVCQNVLVGAAFRSGEPIDSYFVLVRSAT